MPSVLAGARLGQFMPAARRQSEPVVQFAIGEQSAIRGDHRTVEPAHQAAVEIEHQRLAFRFTHRVRHGRPSDVIYSMESYIRIGGRALKIATSSGEYGLRSPGCPLSSYR